MSLFFCHYGIVSYVCHGVLGSVRVISTVMVMLESDRVSRETNIRTSALSLIQSVVGSL